MLRRIATRIARRYYQYLLRIRAAPGSILLYDVVGKALLEAPFLADLRRAMAEQGSPWLFGTDAPGLLAGVHGWSSTVTDVAEPGHRWGRRPTPAVPADVP